VAALDWADAVCQSSGLGLLPVGNPRSNWLVDLRSKGLTRSGGLDHHDIFGLQALGTLLDFKFYLGAFF
jgi:hypothetical protein